MYQRSPQYCCPGTYDYLLGGSDSGLDESVNSTHSIKTDRACSCPDCGNSILCSVSSHRCPELFEESGFPLANVLSSRDKMGMFRRL